MSEFEVLWARAPSLEKLAAEVEAILADRGASDVLSVSHSSAVTTSKRSGGVWAGAHETNRLEYSAFVLVRSGP